jgi:predicted transcriptional regulator of viral defense system
MNDRDAAILAAVEHAGERGAWVTVRKVARHVPDISPTIVGRVLADLAAQGHLTRARHERKDRYRIPPRPKENQ